MKESTGWDSGPCSIGGELHVVSDHEIVGRADLQGGWGHDKPYSFFFSLQSSRSFAEVLLATGGGLQPGGIGGMAVGADGLAAVRLNPGDEPLELRVGVSYVSVAKARASITGEVGDRNFDEIRQESVDAWRPLFDRFDIAGGTDEQRGLFASCLQRLHLHAHRPGCR